MRRKDEMEALASSRRPPTGGGAGKKDRAPSSAQKALIKRNLDLVYGQTLSEPIPDKWLEMLSRLDGAEDKKS